MCGAAPQVTAACVGVDAQGKFYTKLWDALDNVHPSTETEAAMDAVWAATGAALDDEVQHVLIRCRCCVSVCACASTKHMGSAWHVATPSCMSMCKD